MNIGRIVGATREIVAPKDWDHQRQGPCHALPICDALDETGHMMVSAWLPTPDEINAIVAGAPVHLSVYGGIHPPVMLTVGEAPNGAVCLSAVRGYVAPDTDPA